MSKLCDCSKCKHSIFKIEKDNTKLYFCDLGWDIYTECYTTKTRSHFEKGIPRRFYEHD